MSAGGGENGRAPSDSGLAECICFLTGFIGAVAAGRDCCGGLKHCLGEEYRPDHPATPMAVGLKERHWAWCQKGAAHGAAPSIYSVTP